MSKGLSFGFLGKIISREDDPGFDPDPDLSLGYCPACRRLKPGSLNNDKVEFNCLKCGYPLADKDEIHTKTNNNENIHSKFLEKPARRRNAYYPA